ncbi:unnamed protein product, partial [Iphiclides podalirius]
MVDDVKDITENAESKVSSEALDRSRLARERREAEQRKRLDELRAHAAAAQAQRERRDEDRRRRQAEQRARDDDRRLQAEQRAKDNDRRLQVEERKRAIWEASVSRREALLQRERERTERLERARAARSTPRPAFAFGSSTPRLLEPVDSAGFFWAARRAASTTNVMFASAPLTRRASALQLDMSDSDNKDEPDRTPTVVWSSVARRRTDLVPTLPAPRAPGRAYSMTRLDRLAGQHQHQSHQHHLATPTSSPSMHHLSHRSQTRSGETTPGSRPGSALSNGAGVVRRATSAPRKPRPASIAGTGVNTPRDGTNRVRARTGGGDTGANSVATTPSVSRDATTVAGGDAPRRPATARKPRPLSLHASPRPVPPAAPGEGKPPLHRKPKPSKDHDKRGKSQSPGRALSPTPPRQTAHATDKGALAAPADKRQVSAVEVTQKLEALQIGDTMQPQLIADDKINENKEVVENKPKSNPEQLVDVEMEEKPIEVQKPVEKKESSQERKEEKREEKKELPQERKEDKREEKKESSQEKTEENEMTASMMARRITTEEEAKAALAERRRRAREELERQAELERQRLQREAEEEAERQRQEEERQRREEEEARELAALQRRVEEEKLRKAIEAQQELERLEAERRSRSSAERAARLREEEEKRRAGEEAERLRREEAERDERERLQRKQRVEAIMARTRLRKQAEEEKKQQGIKAQDGPQQQTDDQAPTQANSNTTQDTERQQMNKDENDSALTSQTAPVQGSTLPKEVEQSTAETKDSNPQANEQVTIETGERTSVEQHTSSVEQQGAPSVEQQGTSSVEQQGAPSVEQQGTSSVEQQGAPSAEQQMPNPEHGLLLPTERHVPVTQHVSVAVTSPADNGNVYTADLLQLAPSQESAPTQGGARNGNAAADAAHVLDTRDSEDTSGTQPNDNAPTTLANNGNQRAGQLSNSFLQNERISAERHGQLGQHGQHGQLGQLGQHEQNGQLGPKLAEVPRLLDEEFATHNGHPAAHGHPLTLQNAI